MMLCGKFLEILTGNDIACSVSLIHAKPLRQLRRFLPVANFSFVSFGRFYAIYTITAPNAAATAYVRQYGPLQPLQTSGDSPWAWNQGPWPWEKEAN